MFSGLHRKVAIVFTLSKIIISDFWTQSALTHTAMADEEGRGVGEMLTLDDKGGGGVWTPHFWLR